MLEDGTPCACAEQCGTCDGGGILVEWRWDPGPPELPGQEIPPNDYCPDCGGDGYVSRPF